MGQKGGTEGNRSWQSECKMLNLIFSDMDNFRSLQDRNVIMVVSARVRVKVKTVGADEVKELKDWDI